MNEADFENCRHLFKGKSCYPLSPVKGQKANESKVISYNDQVNIIMRGLEV